MGIYIPPKFNVRGCVTRMEINPRPKIRGQREGLDEHMSYVGN